MRQSLDQQMHPRIIPQAQHGLPLGQAKLSPFSFSPQDYQGDSSTLLASPMLKRFTWTDSKPKASLKIE